MFDFLKSHRRAALRRQPLTDPERAVLHKNVPLAAKLDDAERVELEGLIRIFLAEKNFEGCGGLELTDEIRVTIAAQACLLLLHRETDVYPDVESILVYPSAYRAPTRENEGGVVIESEQARLGESWTRGVVVLAWNHVRFDATQPAHGQNVVLNEFAHQLDGEAGSMDGAPDLGARARYTSRSPAAASTTSETHRFPPHRTASFVPRRPRLRRTGCCRGSASPCRCLRSGLR
jgi:Mlc titration factor MtfA (ptsG expression regulator)